MYKILLTITLISGAYVIYKLFRNHLSKEPKNDIDVLVEKLTHYKQTFIDGLEILNESPLDNIAIFMTETYPNLSDSQKLKCSRILYVYLNSITTLLDQIDIENEGIALMSFKPDSWFEMHYENLEVMYRNILIDVYPDIVSKHFLEFQNLSAYTINELQNAIDIWISEDEYQLNEKLSK